MSILKEFKDFVNANNLLGGGSSNSPSGFEVEKFRNSMVEGVGQPTLFKFYLNSIPAIMLQTGIGEELNSFQKVSNNLNNTIESGLDVLKSVYNEAYNLSAYYKEGVNAINTLTSGKTKHSIKDLEFRINKARIPDRTLETYPIKYHGVTMTKPREIAYNTVSISVMCSETYWEHFFFSLWMAHTVSYGTDQATYDVAYYDDVITDANIIFFNTEGASTYKATLKGLYPISVTGIEGDWSKKDSISTFNVTFAVKKCYVDMIYGKGTNIPNQNSDLINTVIGVPNQLGAGIPPAIGTGVQKVTNLLKTL